MNEAETRADYVAPALTAAGWGVVEGSRIRREQPITLGRLEGLGRRGKALTADRGCFCHPLDYMRGACVSLIAPESVSLRKSDAPGRLNHQFAQPL
ncbi:MAG: hypothetical protein L0Y72_10250 [Gemmataceae bacterium]|nr:hypothetical protein [Gemmataceae bacterium]